jgi:hypothetical protein
MNPIMEIRKTESCATKAWAEAPTQPQPRRRTEAENEAATKPKSVPQGGVKDCCG